jgi:hypothetical protein
MLSCCGVVGNLEQIDAAGATLPQSELRLVRRSVEFMVKERFRKFPRKRRGIYVLYSLKRRQGVDEYDLSVFEV